MLIVCHMSAWLCGSMEGARINVEVNVIYGNDSWLRLLRLTVSDVCFQFGIMM
jgi:hypothetical protein